MGMFGKRLWSLFCIVEVCQRGIMHLVTHSNPTTLISHIAIITYSRQSQFSEWQIQCSVQSCHGGKAQNSVYTSFTFSINHANKQKVIHGFGKVLHPYQALDTDELTGVYQKLRDVLGVPHRLLKSSVQVSFLQKESLQKVQQTDSPLAKWGWAKPPQFL